MLKTIIFDIDGVITNLSFFHFLSWKSIFAFYDINLTNEEWTTIAGLPRMTIAKRVLKNHGLNLPLDEIQHIGDEKNKLFVHLIEHGLNPKNVINGVSKLIDDAISRGLQLVAISSSANAVLEMKQLGLYDKFIYVSSYDKISSKSLSMQEKQTVSPLMFALKTLGIKPDECIGLEDSIQGIIEYKRLGIYAVAIANFQEDIKEEGDFWVDLPEQINLEEIIFGYYKKDTVEC